MAANPQNLSVIRHVQPGDPVAAEVTSEPTRAIEIRLKALENTVYNDGAAANGALIIPNVNIQTTGPSAVSLYSAVYFNPADDLYELASANVTLISGTFTSNPTALTVGIIVAINGSQADVMIGGYAPLGTGSNRTALLNALLVEGASGFNPGSVLYLSDIFPGKLTQTAPSLKIQVVLTSDVNYIVAPSYTSPESIENIYVNPIGMRPVGSVRNIEPDFKQSVIVGFDGLEQYDAVNNRWQLTSDGAVTTYQNFGYMVADAAVTIQPANPVYVNISIDTSGNITVFSAATLAALYSGSGSTFNTVAGLTALNSGTVGTIRNYTVQDATGTALGTLKFKFTASDVSLARKVIFKFPEQFQGWKCTNAPITPVATAILSSGVITSITVVEGSIGYTTAPTVVITDGSGTGASATAVINEFGTLTGITVNSGGTGYVAPVITFTTSLASVQVMNGGSGAVLVPTVSGGVITAVAISAGGTGYYLDPDVDVVDPLGVGLGANIIVNTLNGSVVGVTIANGGSGYSGSTLPVLQVVPKFNSDYVVTGSNNPILAMVNDSASVEPTLTPTYSAMGITRVNVTSGGVNYNSGTTITVTPTSGGTGAVLKPILDSSGRIEHVLVVNPGSGYLAPPTLTLANVTSAGITGNGAQLVAEVGCSLVSVAVATGGSGVSDQATASVGTPIRTLEVDALGQGYASAPAVTISAPDLAGGTQATATAVLGGTVVRVQIVNAGSGYSQSAPPTISVSAPPSGTTAVLALAINSAGQIDNVEIINPGSGYVTAPTLTLSAGTGALTAFIEGNSQGIVIGTTITNAGTGYDFTNPPAVTVSGGSPTTPAAFAVVVANDGLGEVLQVITTNPGAGYSSAPTLTVAAPVSGTTATITAYIDSFGVVGYTITNAGNGYVNPPTVTVAAPTFGTTALASCKLLGGTAQLQLGFNGSGGLRSVQGTLPATGNNLQITSYTQDCPGVARPTNAPFYYNIGADPNLASRYPAVPIDKFSFMFNGVELRGSTLNETTRSIADIGADVAATRATIIWSTFDADGCPWDSAFQAYVNDYNATGWDCVIPLTGPVGFTGAFWKLWEQVYAYEIQRNKAWLHINKASRFFQTLRIESLTVVPPLIATDAVTGEQGEPGVPQTGQVILSLDSELVSLGGTGNQINLSTPGNLVVIYQNNTSMPVAIMSILLQTVFQNNSANATANSSLAATVTVGTAAGNYRDIIGTTDTDIASTFLYAVNQVKTLYPDVDAPAPVIMPNDMVYLQVVQPAGSPIVQQVVTAKLQGMFL